MIVLRIAAIASILTSTALSFAANQPRNDPPRNVVVCEPSAGCVHHTIFGHDYKLLSTDRFAVMVFLSNEGRYTRADVSITNLTTTPATLSPEGFRIEAIASSRARVFLYVPPSQLENLPTLAAPNYIPANFETSPRDAARQRAAQDAAHLAAATPHLKAITIPPNQAVHGRVYFERAPGAKQQPVNIVLPIADTIFKFPDIIKP